MVLSLLPKPPRKVDTAFLGAALRARGIEVHRRTIQRDLVELSQVFPLVSDVRAKPYGWRWSEDAVFCGDLPVPLERPPPVKAMEVRLRGRACVLASVIERLRKSSIRVASDDAVTVTTVTIEDNLTSRRLLFAHADEIEVLAPLALRKEIAARARRAFERHESR